MKDYQLTLSEDEINVILGALAQQPYYAVAQLIGNIHKQCEQREG